MRIVLVNWARIWEGPQRGGGVNGYCQSLGVELAGLGHDVVSVCGGSVRSRLPWRRRCGVRRHPDWCGIRVFEIVNSPVAAPGAHQFHDPAGEIASAELEGVFGELLDWLEPDVVHFHNVEGLTAGAVRRAGEGRAGGRGRRVVFSLHNYHPVCPEVYLTQEHRMPCHDYENGHRCPGCAPSKAGRSARRRVLGQWKRQLSMLCLGERFFRRPWSDLRGSTAVRGRGDIEGRYGGVGREIGMRGSRPDVSLPFFDPSLPRHRPLDNTIGREAASEKPPNAYAERRRAMVAALNRCDRVLAVSRFVRDKYVSLGVEAARIERMSIGTRHVELAERARWLLPAARGSFGAGGALRVAFLGFNLPQKGLPMLLDALELLTPELLSGVELHVYGRGLKSAEGRLTRLGARLGGVVTRGGYRPEELPFLLAGIDVGVVPSVWWDAGPQTVFEFLANGVPVVGAAVGGIPDFVRDGENGVLFRGNDRYDLARRLAGLLGDRSLVGRLRAGVEPPKRIEAHAAELVDLYRGLVSSPSLGAAEERA